MLEKYVAQEMEDVNKILESMFNGPPPNGIDEYLLLFIDVVVILCVFCFILERSFNKIKKEGKVSSRKEYVWKIEKLVLIITDSDISQKLKSLVEVLQKVPQRYFDEERLGKYYIPELLSLLEAYCNLSEKDEAAKANILESIEVVTGVSKSILGDLDENEKMKLEINSNVLSQMAKMDGYFSDTTLKEKTYPAS